MVEEDQTHDSMPITGVSGLARFLVHVPYPVTLLCPLDKMTERGITWGYTDAVENA